MLRLIEVKVKKQERKWSHSFTHFVAAAPLPGVSHFGKFPTLPSPWANTCKLPKRQQGTEVLYLDRRV